MQKQSHEQWSQNVLLEQEAICTGDSPQHAITQYFESRFGSFAFASEALSFEHGDRLLAWSSLHAETIKPFLPDRMINITGSPLFASCKPEWKQFYKSFTFSIETPFILACSSYCLSHGMPIYDYLKMVAKQYTKEPVSNFLQYHAESIQFAIEIKKIADKLSHESFLFRPHPSENCDIYDELFADSPNVFVSKEGTIQEVLVNTRALVHSGCSTAIQASIMNIPVFTLHLTPNKFRNYPFRLMNLGFKCTGWEDFCTYLNNSDNIIIESDREYDKQIETENTFERIADMIARESTISLPVLPAKYTKTNKIKAKLVEIMLKVDDLYNRYVSSKSTSSVSGWSSTDFNRFPNAVQSISKQKFGVNICTKQVTINCFLFSNHNK